MGRARKAINNRAQVGLVLSGLRLIAFGGKERRRRGAG